MPKGPNGQKRPADAIGLAVMIGKIATGEIEDAVNDTVKARSEAGSKGGSARAAALSTARKKEIATSAAQSRWATQAPSATPELKEQT
jgi:hypothetical protein